MTSLLDELKVVVHGIWQRRWLAMAVAWGLCLLGWLVIAIIPNSYESRARVLIQVNDDVITDTATSPVDLPRRQNELRQSLTSARNLELVAVASGLIDRGADANSRATAARGLQTAIKTSTTPDSDLLDLSVTIGGGGRSNAENAAMATRILENVVAVFRDQQVRGGAADAEQTIRFLDREIAVSQGKLTTAESARAGFEARNLGMLPGAGSPSIRLESARQEMSQLETQLAAAQSGLAAANAQLASTPPTIAVPGSGGVGASVARQQLASAQGELTGMRARGLTNQHPDVIALTAQIESLRVQVSREPSGGGGNSTPNPAYSSLQSMRAERAAQAGALQSRRAQVAGEIAAITGLRTREPAVAAEYDRLNRDYTVVKDQYDRLVARREQIRLRGAAESNADAVRVDIQDQPSRPTAPSAPNKPLLLIAFLFVGFGGGIAAAFAMSQVQTTYPTTARLARASGLPVIGSVTEILTDELRASRSQRLRRFIAAGAGLGALCALLLAVEIFQRSSVG